MKKFILAIISLFIINVTLSQNGDYQRIEISKKDSLRLIKIPELQYPKGYLSNKTTLPYTVDNSQNMYWRGIFWQSGCSCGQASSEGYVYTYEIDRVRNLDASLNENRYPYSLHTTS